MHAAAGCVIAATLSMLLIGPRVRLHRHVTARENPQVAEAQAWRKGRLELSERTQDTAYVDGHVYNVFPPMFTLIAAVFGSIGWGVPQPFLVFAILLPVVVLAYIVCYQRTGSAGWAVLFSIGLVCGTSIAKVLSTMTRGPTPYYINHALATVGLLLFLLDYFGRRRVWVGCVGLLVAAWSRQLTVLYAIPLLYIALGKPAGRIRRRCVATVCVTGLVIAALPMALDALKFGNPLDSGYACIYNNRPADALARDARTYGLFNIHFVPRNLYYSCLGLPKLHRITMGKQTEIHLRPNFYGTGVWWTTPLLLLVFWDLGRIWGERDARALLIAVVAIFVVLLFYHNTGWSQRGINRFSLDYLPGLYLILLPSCLIKRRRWVVAAMVGWSVLYFVALLPERNIRIW